MDPRLNSAMSLDTAEPPATPIRQPAYAQLNVSSTDRYPNFIAPFENPTTSSNWILQRPNYLLQGYFSRLALTQIQVQNNLPTICASSSTQVGNDQFTINYGVGYNSLSQTITFVLVPGVGSSVTMNMATSLGAGAFTVGNIAKVEGNVTTNAYLEGPVYSWNNVTGALVIRPISDFTGFSPNPPAQTWAVLSSSANPTITVPQGYYTPTTLATALQALIRTALTSVDFTVQWNTATDPNVFTFSSGNAAVFSFLAPQDIGAPSARTRFYNTIGLTSNNCFTSDIQQILGIPTMQFTRWFDVCSSGLTKFQRVKDATTLPQDTYAVTIARIFSTPPSTSPVFTANVAGTPLTWTVDYSSPKYIKWDAREILSNFDLQIRDEFGVLLWWADGNGLEYAFTLLASES
jgi:hypothetical protein